MGSVEQLISSKQIAAILKPSHDDFIWLSCFYVGADINFRAAASLAGDTLIVQTFTLWFDGFRSKEKLRNKPRPSLL